MATQSFPVRFDLITYNTHLFNSDMFKIGPIFEDGSRKDAIDHSYLELVQPFKKSGAIQIAALQEVWDPTMAHDMITDVAKHGSYTNEYCVNEEVLSIIPLNPPGLILLADPACSFHDQTHFDYIKHCTVDNDGWDGQDEVVLKGFLQVKCDFYCDPNHKVSLGLFTTHMPTSYGKHPKSVGCCFTSLANAIKVYRAKYPSSAILLLGDLNIDSDNHNNEYENTVTNILLNGTGLIDAATLPNRDPGFSINPATNTLWQYFNPGQSSTAPTRIDYFFYADSADGTMSVSVDSLKVKTDGLTIPYNGKGVVNCSDHYPVEASITITVTVQD